MRSYSLSVLSIFFLTLGSQDLVSLETLSAEEIENETEFSSDSFLSEEEDLSALPQKGHRPQVVQIPTKTSLSP